MVSLFITIKKIFFELLLFYVLSKDFIFFKKGLMQMQIIFKKNIAN